jgi:hypothetical protein
MFFRLAALALLALSLTLARSQVIQINEILANNTAITNGTNTIITDLVELHNTTAGAVDISGWSMSDSNLFPQRYVFPPGSMIPGLGYHVIMFDSVFTNDPPSSTKVPFGIKASGGFLYMYDPFFNLVDAIEYGLQLENFSIGRNSGGTWVLTTPTFGSNNIVVPMGGVGTLKINEWLADKGGGGPDDYFEIYNGTNKPVALGGLFLTDTSVNPIKYDIAPLSFIGTGALAYVRFVCDGNGTPSGGTNRYPADHVNFKLSPNGTSSLIIYKNDGFTQIDYIPIVAGQESNVSEGRLPDGAPPPFVRFRKLNDFETKSPGEQNFLLFTNFYVNEILTHTDPPLEDAVEFQNRTTTNLDISGWWLSNSRTRQKRYQIPPGPPLPPGGFRVIYEGFNSSTGFNSLTAPDPFTFNSAHGDNVVLSQVDATGKLTGYIAYEEFESAANGVSFGHYRTSVTNKSDYKFVAMSTTTFGDNDAAVNSVAEFRMGTGRTNSYPKVGPIVINEIMYQPASSIYYPTNAPGGTFGQDPDLEFIELRNITPNAVPLYDPVYPTNYWKLKKAISLVFPRTNIAANSFFLVVGFDPSTNNRSLTNFRARFNVSNDVPIFGPWDGRLADGGDAIELYRPDPVQLPPHPDAGFVPFIRIDKVNYLSYTNWPSGASGSGSSLQRKISLAFGNDPTNWTALPPNAGRATPAALLDTDGDGMPDGWEIANNFNPNNPNDAGQDADGDGFTNLAEYLAGTDPHNVASFLRISEIIPFVSSNAPALIRFLAYSNASYTVEFRNSLSNAPNWQRLGDIPSAPSNRVVEVPDPNAYKKADRYYRVVAPITN